MSVIDTSGWGDFQIGSLFTAIGRATRRTINSYADGNVPYVTNSAFNNGISGYLDPKSQTDIEPGRCISVNTVDGHAFWQERDFLANSSGNGLLMLRNNDLNRDRALFICAAITAALDASFTVMLTMNTIREVVIRLPITPACDPDWDYMEQTMRKVMDQQESDLNELSYLAELEQKAIRSSTWGEFSIDDVFEVVKGTRLTKGHMRPGAIRHIGASQFDNGVTAMISNDEAVHPGNLITVCYDGPVGTAFYQPEQFWATDAVNVLYPRFDLNETIGLFLAPVIQEAGSAFNYGQKWGAELMRSTPIRLPITSSGDPDWDYMEQTMKNVITERQATLDSLQVLVSGV